MKVKKLNDQDVELINQINAMPNFKERLREIVQVAQLQMENCQTADQAESALISPVRELGRTALQQWAESSKKKSAKNSKQV